MLSRAHFSAARACSLAWSLATSSASVPNSRHARARASASICLARGTSVPRTSAAPSHSPIASSTSGSDSHGSSCRGSCRCRRACQRTCQHTPPVIVCWCPSVHAPRSARCPPECLTCCTQRAAARAACGALRAARYVRVATCGVATCELLRASWYVRVATCELLRATRCV